LRAARPLASPIGKRVVSSCAAAPVRARAADT